MADPKFRTEIVADPAPYKAGMDQASRVAQDTAQAMAKSMTAGMGQVQNTVQGAVSGMTGMFQKMQNMVIGVGAAIAGGGAFASALNQSKELTVESQKLGRALGVSATEGSILAVALGDIYQTSDTLLTANSAMTRTLRENEEGVRKLGVATREQNGGFRNSLDIMLDVNKKLAEFKEGTDRNIEGQKVYKKAWAEVAPIIKLNADVMEDAAKKATALNLVVGTEQVETVTKYRASMNDVGDVLQAVGKAVGDVVMPVFTDLGNWFASTGPERVEVMRKATAILVAGFYSMHTVVITVYETIKAFVATSTVLLLKFAEMLGFALKGDFAGAKAAWERGTEQQVDIWRGAMARIRQVTEENREKTAQAFARGFDAPKVTPIARASGGGGSSGGEDKNAFAKWEAELKAARDAYDRMKLDQGSFEQYTLEMESAFWAKKMLLSAGNEKLQAATTVKYYDVERQIRKNAFEAEIAGLQQQMAAAETSAAAKIDLANKVYVLEVQRYGAASKEAIAALQNVQKAVDEWSKQQIALVNLRADAERDYQLGRVELERSSLETMEQLGIINGQQKIARLRELKAIELAINQKSLEGGLEQIDPSTDPVKYQEQLNKIRQLREKHLVDMAQLDNQAAVETKKIMDKWLDPISDGFQQMINGLIAGTRKWSDVVRSSLISVAQQYLGTFVKIGVEWVKTELLKTQATVASVAVRTAAEATGSTASTASTAGSAIANIGAKAWEAAASVYASIAQIPYVGPFLAPAMAVAAAAMVVGFIGNIAKASGGFDVPQGVSPITQLHSGEMVLPQNIANPLRDMIAGGQTGGGATHFHVHTMDVGGVRDFLRNNADVLTPALRKLARTAPATPR